MSGGDLPAIGYRPIGVAHSPLVTRGAPPVQSTFSHEEGSIGIFPGFRDGLRDIGGFSRFIAIYDLDRAEKRTLAGKPLPDGEACHGIFATRHLNRPTPGGISCVAVTGIRGGVIAVKGIDLPDGTPVPDIRPYIPGIRLHPRCDNGMGDSGAHRTGAGAGTGAGHR